MLRKPKTSHVGLSILEEYVAVCKVMFSYSMEQQDGCLENILFDFNFEGGKL
jgi:hypothetical protein